MNKKKFILLFLLGTLLSCSSVNDKQVIVSGDEQRLVYYVDIKNPMFLNFPPPPAAGSDEEKRDFLILHEWQDKRTDKDCELANAESHADYEELFGDISPFINPEPEDLKKTLKDIKKETDYIVGIVKERYNRPRPFHKDETLSPCLGKIGGLAYPSGHATISRVYANLLSDLVPARSDEFFKRADLVALNRVIGGVHHPTDIEAGKKLGDIIYNEFKKDKNFQHNLVKLRSYLK
ncbi:MAG: phosphatase PAP2 family protein [Elusimicrobia bacterium]|jgi:acid phosphatase (class A)|nr:phosphatase PAP2 family protein [Elusimicrobiota bacterium]